MEFDKSFMNSQMTTGLFIELNPGCDYACFTLGEKDIVRKGKTYISLYKRYMSEADLTELDFARKYFLNFTQWSNLCESPLFAPYITMWRRELELTIRSRALAAVIREAEDPTSRNSYEANKFLLQGKWRTSSENESMKPARTRGRPSREEIKQRLEIDAETARRLTNDLERIQIDPISQRTN